MFDSDPKGNSPGQNNPLHKCQSVYIFRSDGNPG